MMERGRTLLVFNLIPCYGQIKVYRYITYCLSIYLLWICQLFPPFGYYKQYGNNYLRTSFCMDISFHFELYLIIKELTNCQNRCTILHSHEQCRRVLSFSHFSHHLSAIFIRAILSGIKQYPIMVLIYISWITTDVEQSFRCLLATCISSSEKCLLKSFDHFQNQIIGFLYYCVLRILHVFRYKFLIRYMTRKFLHPFRALSFHFLYGVLWYMKFLIWVKSHLFIYYLFIYFNFVPQALISCHI